MGPFNGPLEDIHTNTINNFTGQQQHDYFEFKQKDDDMIGGAGISEEDPFRTQLRGPFPHQQPLRPNRSLWVPEDPL